MGPSPKEWLTVKEFAAAINASMSYVRKAIAAGRIAASNIALGPQRAEWRIHRSQIDRLLGLPSGPKA